MSRLFGQLGALSLAAGLASSCLYDVEPGTRALVNDKVRGQFYVVGEGTHFRIPGSLMLMDVIPMDIRATPRVINSATGTKDLQMVNISLRVLCRPKVDELSKIYNTIGADFAERVMPSIGNEVLKVLSTSYIVVFTSVLSIHAGSSGAIQRRGAIV
jgi:prohibitin 1